MERYNAIMRLRRVCSKWKDAAKKTIVPPSDFAVHNLDEYNAMRIMTTALPNLQQLTIWGLDDRRRTTQYKFNDGEDRDERRAAETSNWTRKYNTHDIDIISNFTKLRFLNIQEAHLNGRYPVLFNFPLLQKLSIMDCRYLKWDLEVLDGLPMLRYLYCYRNQSMSGSLNSLRVLKDTLEMMDICNCPSVGGNFMDLADFPHMKELNLRSTSVTGDIRDMRENDFQALESLSLPEGVHGGFCYKIQHISDVPSLMQAIHILLQRSPTLFEKNNFLSRAFLWSLAEDSHDWYAWEGRARESPPFDLKFIQAGSRRGWSWCSEGNDHSCEINWLDPEPNSASGDYEAYIEELPYIERFIDFYRGYHQPPTEEEYRRLCEGLA
jgi:hypothetical protein